MTIKCALNYEFTRKAFHFKLFHSIYLIHLFTFISTTICLQINYKHIYPHYVDNLILKYVQN